MSKIGCPTNDLNNVVALDTQAGTPVEYFSVTLGSNPFPTSLVDVDETHHAFGLTPGGLYVVDASQGQATPPTVVPLFGGIASTQANPNVGPLAGGTQVQFIPAPLGAGSADGIANSMEAYFGTVPATNDVVGPYPALRGPLAGESSKNIGILVGVVGIEPTRSSRISSEF